MLILASSATRLPRLRDDERIHLDEARVLLVVELRKAHDDRLELADLLAA